MDLSKLQLMNWNVKWGTYDLGAVDKVTPDMTLTLTDKMVGSMGKVVLGAWIVALDGKISVEAREMSHLLFQQITPWNAALGAAGTNTASVPLFPASLGTDLYDSAKQLILHPSTFAADNLTMDLTFAKAVPILPKAPADGVTPNVVPIDFMFYPDRGQFPNLVYGWFGPPPS